MTTAKTTLAFVGDIMLGRHISSQLHSVRPQVFWGDILPTLQSTDAVIGNLECPITTHAYRWSRTRKAFHFKAHPNAIDVLKIANVQMVNLANNHLLDFDERGLLDTIDYLNSAAISHAGAGLNAYDAAKPALKDISGTKVGLIGLTDNMPEWRAGHSTSGVNYIKVKCDNVTLNMVRMLIEGARQQGADIVIVSCHWGPNLRSWPTRRFRQFARDVIELGAHVFHGHSAHIVQGIELYRGGLILYDTGDILDDFWVFPGLRTDLSFVFISEFNSGQLSRLALLPVAQERTSVHLAHGAEFDLVCRKMERRCKALGTPLVRCPGWLEVAPSLNAHRQIHPTQPESQNTTATYALSDLSLASTRAVHQKGPSIA